MQHAKRNVREDQRSDTRRPQRPPTSVAERELRRSEIRGIANRGPDASRILAIITRAAWVQFGAPLAFRQKRGGGMKQYKVLTQKDKWFSGKFDPDQLEQALNAYAQQ